MSGQTKSVGARRIVEVILGEGRAVYWSRRVLRVWGFLLVLFVLFFVWLPIRTTPAGSQVLWWLAIYTGYVLILEVFASAAKRRYESKPFQWFRIQFNLVMNAILIWVAPAAGYGYLWFFFSMPILAVLLYVGSRVSLVVTYFEICIATILVSFARGWLTPVGCATVLAHDAILGLLAAVFYFFVRFFPQLSEEHTLSRAATTLISVLDQKQLCQSLADAAKVGVRASDAVVVHLLRGEDNSTLVPMASSHLDITTLGRTLMGMGSGIAGYAIQNHGTVNVPDVNEDARYLQLHPSVNSIKSLLVAPMYVGDKDVGTISVHSAKKGAFGEREERFLTTLAAQGATAIANAELYDIHTRRKQQLSDILEASRTFGMDQPRDALLETIAAEVRRCSGYRMAAVNLLDEASDEIVVRAMVGVPPEGRCKLQGARIPPDVWKRLLRDEFQISQSYFIRYDRRPEIPDLDQYTFTLDLGGPSVGRWHHEDMLIVPIQTREEELLGYISVDDPSDRRLPTLDTIQALEVLASVAATAIRNACLYQELQQRAAQLALINDVAGKIAPVLELGSVLDRAAYLVQKSFGYHHVALFTLDRKRGAMLMRAKAGDFTGLFPPDHYLELGRGMVGWVAENGQICLANDVQAESRYVNFFPGVIPTQSELSVPIRVREEVVGVLDVQSAELNAFDENDVLVMEILADQVAVAIENAQLYEARQKELTERSQAQKMLLQRNSELELLYRVGQALASVLDLDQVLVNLLEGVRHLLGVTAASVWMVEPESGGLVCQQAAGSQSDIARGWRLAPREGIAGWVVHHSKTLLVPNTRTDQRHFKGVDEQTGLELRSILGVPMQVKKEVIGVLEVVDTEANRFKPTDSRLVELLAAAAATAIANARLYEETDRLRAFNENILQTMEEGILIEDTSGNITFVNRRTAELLGYTPEELIGLHCTAIVAPEEVAKVEEELGKRPQGVAGRYETVLLTKTGKRVHVIVSATPMVEGGMFTGVVCVYTDITDRKRQETRLREYLSTVTNSLAHHTTLEGLYRFIVEAGARFLSACDCSLFLVSKERTNILELVATTTSSPCADRPCVPIRSGARCGLVADSAATSRPVRLVGGEITQHPSWNGELWEELGWDFDPEGKHSFLAAPALLRDGRLVGVLVARDTESPFGFSGFDEVLLETLATNAAADIERVRGVEKVRKDAVHAERERLETDLHEAMNVLATGVRWEAEILSDEMDRGDSTRARFALKRLQAALTRAYTDLRYLLEDLRDPTLEQEGLIAALTKRAELIGRGRIQVRGDCWKRPPPEVEGILYRVGQEAMDNAVKYSGVVHDPGVKIEVWLEQSDERARIFVKDNGMGFDVASPLALSRKWGLRRLRDMVNAVGGSLEIDSVLGKGTTVCATVDLSKEDHG